MNNSTLSTLSSSSIVIFDVDDTTMKDSEPSKIFTLAPSLHKDSNGVHKKRCIDAQKTLHKALHKHSNRALQQRCTRTQMEETKGAV